MIITIDNDKIVAPENNKQTTTNEEKKKKKYNWKDYFLIIKLSLFFSFLFFFLLSNFFFSRAKNNQFLKYERLIDNAIKYSIPNEKSASATTEPEIVLVTEADDEESLEKKEKRKKTIYQIEDEILSWIEEKKNICILRSSKEEGSLRHANLCSFDILNKTKEEQNCTACAALKRKVKKNIQKNLAENNLTIYNFCADKRKYESWFNFILGDFWNFFFLKPLDRFFSQHTDLTIANTANFKKTLLGVLQIVLKILLVKFFLFILFYEGLVVWKEFLKRISNFLDFYFRKLLRTTKEQEEEKIVVDNCDIIGPEPVIFDEELTKLNSLMAINYFISSFFVFLFLSCHPLFLDLKRFGWLSKEVNFFLLSLFLFLINLFFCFLKELQAKKWKFSFSKADLLLFVKDNLPFTAFNLIFNCTFFYFSPNQNTVSILVINFFLLFFSLMENEIIKKISKKNWINQND